MKEIKDRLQKYIDLLPVGRGLTQLEAERRAGEFLTAMSFLTDLRHSFAEDRISATTQQNAVFATQLAACTGKTVTENKVTVEASEEYIAARERFEQSENDITYLKTYFEIFSNAHVLYRQLAKSENN